ncbi:MAG: hypothetical protein Q7U55_09485, partial [Deltaproteobacteria bacterium]|nr:hypothetical protein [Deltaproteobacteria bacterium]
TGESRHATFGYPGDSSNHDSWNHPSSRTWHTKHTSSLFPEKRKQASAFYSRNSCSADCATGTGRTLERGEL